MKLFTFVQAGARAPTKAPKSWLHAREACRSWSGSRSAGRDAHTSGP